jgi:hypothetical protein
MESALGVAAIVGVIAVATQSGSAVLLAIICLIVAAVAYLREEEAEQEGTRLSDPAPPPAQSGYQQREPSVWSGVKIGFGMFIVLPILLFLLVLVLIAFLGAL